MTESLLQSAVTHPRQRRLTPEFRGYLFWGPVALAIAVTELLGVGWVQKKLGVTVPWPTISTTVGHLQERWNVVAALVLGVIAAIAFTTVAYRNPEEKTEYGRSLPPDRSRPIWVPFYGWQLGIFPAVLAGVVAATLTDNEYVVGYAIYASFALYGVIIPSLLVRFRSREVNFPTLFFTFGMLRRRYRWVTATFVALLVVLVFHLALYPWPNITSEPSKYAGLKADAARAKAVRELKRLGVSNQVEYSTQARGVTAGKDAWLVFFSPRRESGREYSACMVSVTKNSASVSPECAS